MQAKRVWCKAAESVRGASGVAEALAAGEGGGFAQAAHLACRSRPPCLALKNELKKVTSALQVPGPSRSWDLAPARSSAIALTQPMPLNWLLLLFALLGLQLQPRVGIDEQDCRPGRTCSPRIVATSLDFVEPQRLHQLLLLPPSWWPSGCILDGSRGTRLALAAPLRPRSGSSRSYLFITGDSQFEKLRFIGQRQTHATRAERGVLRAAVLLVRRPPPVPVLHPGTRGGEKHPPGLRPSKKRSI